MDFQPRSALAALLAAALFPAAGVVAARSHDGAATRGERVVVEVDARIPAPRLQSPVLQFAQAVAPPLNGGQPNVGLSGGAGSVALSGGPGSAALSGGTAVVMTPLPAGLPPQSIRPNPLPAPLPPVNGRPSAFTGALSGMPGTLPGLSGGTPGLTPSRPGLTPLKPTPLPDPVP